MTLPLPLPLPPYTTWIRVTRVEGRRGVLFRLGVAAKKKTDLLLAPAKVPRNCQKWRSDGEYGRGIAILGNSEAAYNDPVAL